MSASRPAKHPTTESQAVKNCLGKTHITTVLASAISCCQPLVPTCGSSIQSLLPNTVPELLQRFAVQTQHHLALPTLRWQIRYQMSQRLLSQYKQSKQLSLWRLESSTNTLAEMRQQGPFLCLPNAWVHTQYGILDWHSPFTPYPRLMFSSFTNAHKPIFSVFCCPKLKAPWSDAVTPGSSGVAYPKTKIARWSSSICNHKIYEDLHKTPSKQRHPRHQVPRLVQFLQLRVALLKVWVAPWHSWNH